MYLVSVFVIKLMYGVVLGGMFVFGSDCVFDIEYDDVGV